MSASHLRLHRHDDVRRDGSRGAARALCDTIVAMARRYERERRIAAEANYLKSFDDHMLSDIGLTRAEIDGFVRRRATQGMPRGGGDAVGIAAALRPLPSVYDRA